MPRFGVVNERRHQLHEVIRLSGINLIINDMDIPLIIKVGSIPKERMQVYFIDNDDYFKRKAVFTDENDQLFDDNDERIIFFTKGVLETVKKLNWAPDIIHIHGWMASLLPLYIKEYYKEDPIFTQSKIVSSVYNNGFEGALNPLLIDKLKFDKLDSDKTDIIKIANHTNIIKSAIENSDAIIKGDRFISDDLNNFIDNANKPVLEYQSEETLAEAYLDFYTNQVLEK